MPSRREDGPLGGGAEGREDGPLGGGAEGEERAGEIWKRVEPN